MKISINKQIKRLRTEQNWTQEELAEKLNVSTQAVSRWETNVTYPDIELLPSIANLFHISVDELLGVGYLQNNSEVVKILEDSNKCYHIGDIKKMIDILEKGIKEYPTNTKLIMNLIQALSSYYEEDRTITCNKIIKLGNMVIDDLKDINEKCNIYQIMTYTYLELNNKEKALECLNKLPDISYSANFIKPLLLEGQEEYQYLQYLIQSLTNYLVVTIKNLTNTKNNSNQKKIKLLNKAQNLIELVFENKDYGYELYLLKTINLELAINYAKEKDIENTLNYLENSIKYATLFDNLPKELKHTSILVDETTFNLEENFGKDYQTNELESLRDILTEECFCFLEKEIRFQKIISKF